MGEKMVVVVGAGASRDFGLPMGTELKERIAKRSEFAMEGHNIVANDQFTRELLDVCNQRKGNNSFNEYLQTFNAISKALPLAISIDNYLDAHNANPILVQCGKIGIFREILMAEHESTLFSKVGKFNAKAIDKTWLAEFFRVVTEGCTLQDISARLRGITFVIFNYDRCVEHFFYHALQVYYRIGGEQAAVILSAVNFLHPYGSLGPLPWQDANRSLGFGEGIFPDRLVSLSDGILTFTESHNVHVSDISKVRRAITATPMLVFLGFAFHRINMDLLFSNIGNNLRKKIFATAYLVSKSDCSHIAFELQKKFHGNHELRSDLMCNQLFSEYSKAISLAAE